MTSTYAKANVRLAIIILIVSILSMVGIWWYALSQVPGGPP